MTERTQISQTFQSSLPESFITENPKFVDFLKQYYISQEFKGASVDLISNLDEYKDLDSYSKTNIDSQSTLTAEIGADEDTIPVESTAGWPAKYGLLKINNEIITYTGITTNSFIGCSRGFSGISNLKNSLNKEKVVFETSEASSHSTGSVVYNLSNLFLKDFFDKFKKQFAPGFENRELDSNIDDLNFYSRVKDFFKTKGTDESIKILFRVLFGKEVEVIKPQDYLLKPSDSNYEVVEKLVCKRVSGDPLNLKGFTLFQDANPYDSRVLKASGSISDVDVVRYNTNPLKKSILTSDEGLSKTTLYYIISLSSGYNRDSFTSGTIEGEFKVASKTICTVDATEDKNVITVDSTVSFPSSGSFYLEDKDGRELITYNSKSINQFVDCSIPSRVYKSGSFVRSFTSVYGYENNDPTKKVELIITGVLNNFESGPISSLSGFIISKESEIIGSINGTGTIIGSNTISGTGFISGAGDYLDEDEKIISWKIIGNIAKSNIDGIIYETGNPLLDGSKFKGSFNQSEEFGQNLLVGDPIKIKSIGKIVDKKNPYFSSWIYNVSPRIEVEEVLDAIGNEIKLKTFDEHDLKKGDEVQLIDSSTNNIVLEGKIELINSSKVFTANSTTSFGTLSNDKEWEVRRKIKFGKFLDGNTDHSNSNIESLISSIQNTYDSEFNAIVASESIPNYEIGLGLGIKKFSSSNISNNTITINDHGFYSGDYIYYYPEPGSNPIENIFEGYYYIIRINSNEVQLAKSINGVIRLSDSLIQIGNGDLSSTSLDYQIIPGELANKTFTGQKLLKFIPKETSSPNEDQSTPIGPIGMFVNGVEVINYKSPQQIHYGKIEKIDVLNGGDGYDVINPPTISISSNYEGIGAKINLSLIGDVKKINIDDAGFDFIEEPKITLSGGGGRGCKLKARLLPTTHKVEFDAGVTGYVSSGSTISIINTSNNSFRIESKHKFREADEIVYKSNGNTAIPISGVSTTPGFIPSVSPGASTSLKNNSRYFVSRIDDKQFRLHFTREDAIFKRHPINIVGFGTGPQEFRSVAYKNILSDVIVVSPGENYKNKKREISPIGINTSDNIINIQNHDYQDGDIIVYSYEPGSTPISGLSSSKLYQVTVFDDDNFRLSSAGVSTNISTKNYERSKFVRFESSGSGTHIFNYPPIEVSIEGKTGIGLTFGGEAKLSPAVRGSITSVSVIDGGQSYGSTDGLINFDSSLISDPLIEVNSGENAILEPIIINGSISFVNVKFGGSGYTSKPDLKIIDPDETGVGAILNLTINSSGSVESVSVVYGGVGYGKNTAITIVPLGSGVIFKADLQKWNINLFEKNKNNITDDDGIFIESKDSNLGIGYGSLYAPRKLRSSLITNFGDGVSSDLEFNSTSGEVNRTETTEHSPIIGWAYDGNPIYGPYGYENKKGGFVKLLDSGYDLKFDSSIGRGVNGPPVSIFPLGFFTEDYEYKGNGDLDEHNGRFCITPEFPGGTYAYFASYKTASTSGENEKTTSSPFFNYKKPVFPYIIGERYKSLPNRLNFDPRVNQRDIDLNDLNVIRNTSPYKFLDKNSSYEYVIQPQRKNEIVNRITQTSSGSIAAVEIINSGNNYKVGDRTIANMEGTGSNVQSIAEVKSVVGVGISNISFKQTKIENINISFGENELIVGTSTLPHNLKNGDIVTFFDSSTAIRELDGPSIIGITTFKTSLSVAIGNTDQTGITTSLFISSNLLEVKDQIKINDYLNIGSEKVKIVGLDPSSNSLNILREELSTTGTSHTAGSDIILDSREFIFTKNISNKPNIKKIRQFYFNPRETVGLGDVGISTYNFYEGSSSKQREIKLQSIYIENHGLKTGDKLIYSSLYGSAIGVTTDSITQFPLENESLVYAVNLGKDFVGLSTSSVAISSEGNYIGVSTEIIPSVLYFMSYGSGDLHSLRTPSPTLNTNIKKSVGIITTKDYHNLLDGDKVNIEINSSVSEKLYEVEYNSTIRKSIFNPRSSIGIDIDTNILTIENHGYETGDRILYESTNPALPLESERIYYVHKISNNKIKLTYDEWDARFSLPVKEVDLTTQGSSHRISSVNPHIKLTAYSSVGIDVSHPSLKNLKLAFFKDEAFVNEFETTEESTEIKVERIGTPGITENAMINLKLDENFPNSFYYQLKPTDIEAIKVDNEFDKLNILPDLSPKPFNSNKIDLIFSRYNGRYSANIEDEKTFSILLDKNPERNYYNHSDLSKTKYSTESKNYFGPIDSLRMIQKSSSLKKIPQVVSIASTVGSGANISFVGEEIGNIKKLDISNIGFEFSSDKTLKPIADIPTVIGISDYHQIESIKVTDSGKDYTIPPRVLIYDSQLKQPVEEVITETSIFGSSVSEVNVIDRGSGLSDTNLFAISVDNTNGVDIISAQFDVLSEIATLTLQSPSIGFTTDTYPFVMGEKIFIEGIDIISGTGQGYNSSDYDYATFDVVGVNTAIGLANGATLSYRIPGISTAGIYNQSSLGSAIKYSNLAKYQIVMKGDNSNLFSKGEAVNFGSLGETSAFVVDNQGWDQNTSKLRINQISGKEIKVGVTVRSQTTSAKAIVKSIEKSSGRFSVDSTGSLSLGSSKDTGKLSNFFQRLHDNNYYQRFSYSIKGTTDINKWDDAVGSLVHTSGFKRFGDYVVESSPVISEESQISGISTITSVNHLINFIDVDRIHDFDLVVEDKIGSCSKNIFFDGKIISDYFRSDKNRAITLDDFSGEFRSNPNLDVFVIIDSFYGNTMRTCKYIVEMYNSMTNSYEVANFLLIHNNFEVFINDYTGTYSNNPFGQLSAQVLLGEIQIRFFPYDPDDNIYMKVYRTAIRDDIVDDETVSIGFLDRVGLTTIFNASPGVASKMASIDITQYESYGFILQVGTASSNTKLPIGSLDYQSTEGFATYDSNLNDYSLVFGDVDTFRELGTFDTSYSSGNLDINFTLDPGIAATTFTGKLHIVGFANTTGMGSTFIGPIIEEDGGSIRLKSNITEIASSASPGITTISSMISNEYRSSKHLVQVISDSGEKHVNVIVGIHNDTDTYYTEYANLYTNTSLGTYDYVLVDEGVDLRFTPNAGIGVTVKVFSEEFKKQNVGYAETSFSHIDIFVDDFTYVERLKRFRHDFELKHRGNSLFSKKISLSGISTNTNVITFINQDNTSDDHFFVTGEEINYSYSGKSEERISVMTGTGYTDKLPDSVFVIKKSENSIQLSTSRTDALAGIALTITDAYEYMSDQSFDAINSNKKCIIMIDNIIQTPLSWTPISYNLTSNISGISTEISLTGITSIRNGDVLSIGNEFVRVDSLNTPLVNGALVQRSWMGTNLLENESHASGDEVRLYRGDYNIIKDKIYFKNAPFGSNEVGKDFLALSDLRASSSFQGRFFQKSSYEDNIIFDDISTQFNGIGRTFSLTEEGNSVVGIALTENANSIVLLRNISQKPSIDFTIESNVGIGTRIHFTGRKDYLGNNLLSDNDPNKNDIPLGGVIVSIASSQGFGLQPQMAAVGVASISHGQIESVSIGTNFSPPLSGYTTTSFPGSGYTQPIVPINFSGSNGSGASGHGVVNAGIITEVVITNPGSGYTTSNPPSIIFDSPLPYENLKLTGSSTGIGASINVMVGQGSSVIDFHITNFGYGYEIGDVLTPVGILEDANVSSSPFSVTVTDVYNEPFSSWNIGILELVIDISNQFDGIRRTFTLERQGDIGIEPLSIEKGSYSAIDLDSNLLIIIDGILQRPGIDYTFKGGTQITFSKAPKKDYKCQIFFYKGSFGDTQFVDIEPPIEVGDQLQLATPQENLLVGDEKLRTIVGINSSNSVKTSIYCMNDRSELLRPSHLIKQKRDLIVGGESISKKRLSLEAEIRPESTLIRPLNNSDTTLFVDSISKNFNLDSRPSNDIIIISQDFSENNTIKSEIIADAAVSGGHGSIIGIGTKGVGINTTSPMIEFTIRSDESINAGTIGITTGVYFIVSNSNIGNGVTSIEIDTSVSIVGIGTSFIDNIYRVDNIITDNGTTTVCSNVSDLNGITSTTMSDDDYYGTYSWGSITGTRASNPSSFSSYNNNGVVGLTTSPIVKRYLPFKIDF